MKFRFLGDGDCPDWILHEIHSSLCVLTSVKLKIFCTNVVKSILGEPINEEKFANIFGNSSKDDLRMSKAAFATVRYLLLSACRYNSDSNTFNAELQQLGLPREHANVMGKTLDDNATELKKYLLSTTLRINDLESCSARNSETAIDCIELQLDLKNETHKINIHQTDIPILINELKNVKQLMESHNFEGKHSI